MTQHISRLERAKQRDGVADHAAPNDPSTGVRAWIARARKAVIAFVASGALAGLAPAIVSFDWHTLTWASLWDGIGSGFVGAVLVYAIRNEAPKLGIDPAMEQLIEEIVDQKLRAKLLRRAADKNSLSAPATNPGHEWR